MPLYEYVCRDCQQRFERLVRSFTESVQCPACRSAEVEKQLSTFAMAGGGTPQAASCCGRGGCGCH